MELTRCIYCGIEFSANTSCNPDDYGLHDIPAHSNTCPMCNFITEINRAMAIIIKEPDSDRGYRMLKENTDNVLKKQSELQVVYKLNQKR